MSDTKVPKKVPFGIMSYSTDSITPFSLHSPLGFEKSNYPHLQNAYINKKGNVHITLKCVHITTVAVEKQ
jgi:hypothetical protein